MIRKHFQPFVTKPSVALAALPLLSVPLLALPALAQNDAAPTPSVAVAMPAVTAEPSPPANIAFQAMRGIVITRPGCNAARLSLGERNCLRVGARIEYLKNGLQFATGRVTALNYSDAVATVEPEAADHYVNINTDFRVLENPSHNLGPTQTELDEREYRRFERNFAISAAIAAAVYYIWIKD